MLENINEISELLAEGFLADRIVQEKDYDASRKFVKDIGVGRLIIKFGKLTRKPFKPLRRYNWFLQWLLLTYGHMTFNSKKDADKFLEAKIIDIGEDINDWVSFWNWLRKQTLSETSKLMLCG